MLGQFEQQPLYNAMNFSRSIYSGPNSTVYAAGLATLWCPSDGQIIGKRSSFGPYVRQSEPDRRLHQLRGCTGTWHPEICPVLRLGESCRLPLDDVNLLDYQPIESTMNGVFHYVPRRSPSITDGTSNTFCTARRRTGFSHRVGLALLQLVGRFRQRRHAVLDAVPDQRVQEGPARDGRIQ